MYFSCLDKQAKVKELFAPCRNAEERYETIIELGRALSPMDEREKVEENRVYGCQSLTYLKATLKGGEVFFAVTSEALISRGLAALLLYVYSGERPEVVIKCPPNYLEELGISASLTPSRANGLYSMHLRMQQEALKLLMQMGGD